MLKKAFHYGIDCREIIEVRKIDGDFDDIVKAATCRLRDGLQVCKDLSCARFEIAIDDFHGIREQWNLPGKKHEIARLHRLGIWSYRGGCVLAMDGLFITHLTSRAISRHSNDIGHTPYVTHNFRKVNAIFDL